MAAGGFFDELARTSAETLMDSTPPPPEVVEFFHAKASTDGADDIHHRLGFNRTDAARGDHNHDGQNSKPLFDATQLPGDTSAGYTMAQMSSTVNIILARLRERSG